MSNVPWYSKECTLMKSSVYLPPPWRVVVYLPEINLGPKKTNTERKHLNVHLLVARPCLLLLKVWQSRKH